MLRGEVTVSHRVLRRDLLDFLMRPDEALRAITGTAAEMGSAEDQAERELVAHAAELRELDVQEEQLLDSHSGGSSVPRFSSGRRRRSRRGAAASSSADQGSTTPQEGSCPG